MPWKELLTKCAQNSILAQSGLFMDEHELQRLSSAILWLSSWLSRRHGRHSRMPLSGIHRPWAIAILAGRQTRKWRRGDFNGVRSKLNDHTAIRWLSGLISRGQGAPDLLLSRGKGSGEGAANKTSLSILSERAEFDPVSQFRLASEWYPLNNWW